MSAVPRILDLEPCSRGWDRRMEDCRAEIGGVGGSGVLYVTFGFDFCLAGKVHTCLGFIGC